MPAKKPVHTGPHKYKRVSWGKRKTEIWRCMLLNCPHYVHDIMVIGRRSICWSCGQPFTLNADKARRVKPKCDSCQKAKDPVFARLDELLENL